MRIGFKRFVSPTVVELHMSGLKYNERQSILAKETSKLGQQ